MKSCQILFQSWALLTLKCTHLAQSFPLSVPKNLRLSPSHSSAPETNKFGRRTTVIIADSRDFNDASTTNIEGKEALRDDKLNQLLELIGSTPPNAATSKQTTEQILTAIREVEKLCPTADIDVLTELGGNWELLWTSQDQKSEEWRMGPLRTWINPLENQSYSNNPNGDATGRANPVLPRPIQDRLEQIGLIQKNAEASVTRSSQAIDLKRKQVRNVVAFNIPSAPVPRKATLTVTVDFRPNNVDKRKVDVKFQACRVSISKSPIDLNIPLGFIGPTGWLRTGYIDGQIRITRGHKGSVFVLCRPSGKVAAT